jgi:hypothetical protein
MLASVHSLVRIGSIVENERSASAYIQLQKNVDILGFTFVKMSSTTRCIPTKHRSVHKSYMTFPPGLIGTFASVEALLVGAVASTVPTFTITAPLVKIWRKQGEAAAIAYIGYAGPSVAMVRPTEKMK